MSVLNVLYVLYKVGGHTAARDCACVPQDHNSPVAEYSRRIFEENSMEFVAKERNHSEKVICMVRKVAEMELLKIEKFINSRWWLQQQQRYVTCSFVGQFFKILPRQIAVLNISVERCNIPSCCNRVSVIIKFSDQNLCRRLLLCI